MRAALFAFVLAAPFGSAALAADVPASRYDQAIDILLLQEGFYGATAGEVRKRIVDGEFVPAGSVAADCEHHAGPIWKFRVQMPDPDDTSLVIDGHLGLDQKGEPACVTIPFID